jgi:hypothetical protein
MVAPKGTTTDGQRAHTVFAHVLKGHHGGSGEQISRQHWYYITKQWCYFAAASKQ